MPFEPPDWAADPQVELSLQVRFVDKGLHLHHLRRPVCVVEPTLAASAEQANLAVS